MDTESLAGWRAEIEAARHRIAPLVRETECRRSEALSRRIGGEVFLKLENLQHSGSFKLRGVANRLLCRPPHAWQRQY